MPQLLKELNGYSREGTVYRIGLLRIGDDPRGALREDDALDEEQWAALRQRLDRLDRSSPLGPWTADFLRLIDKHPGVLSNLKTLLETGAPLL